MRLPRIKQYPKSLTIHEQTYTVRFVRKVQGEANTMGSCDPSTHTIRIKLGQTPSETFATLVHEIIHAFEFEYEIDIKHKAVYGLEKAIVQFLLVNF